MKIIAIYNIKGGVGKTTTAVNLAYLSTKMGAKSLVWDLDPQGAASFYFRVKPKIKGGTRKLLRGRKTLSDIIRGTNYPTLDLVPADLSYRNFDLALQKGKGKNKAFKRLLKPLQNQYDFVFLDCPPSFSTLSENVFSMADILAIPMIPTTLSVRTFWQLLEFLDKEKMNIKGLTPFFTMVDRRKKMHSIIVDELPQQRPEFLTPSIPNATVVEQMGHYRQPLHAFAPSGPAAKSYSDVWAAIYKRLFPE